MFDLLIEISITLKWVIYVFTAHLLPLYTSPPLNLNDYMMLFLTFCNSNEKGYLIQYGKSVYSLF